MNKHKHTPAPWEEDCEGGWLVVGDERGPAAGVRVIIADAEPGLYVTEEEAAANRRLIIAAPLLLDAAMDIDKAIEKLPMPVAKAVANVPGFVEALRVLRAVITNARWRR